MVRLGPFLYVPRGLSEVLVPPTSTIAPVVFQFPRQVMVTGLRIMAEKYPQPNPFVNQAALALRIQDEQFHDLVSDGQGGSLFAQSLALSGLGGRWFPLQRPVNAGDLWTLTIANVQTFPVRATVLLRIGDLE